MIGGKFQVEVSQLRDHGTIGKEARARPIICNQLFLTDTNAEYQTDTIYFFPGYRYRLY